MIAGGCWLELTGSVEFANFDSVVGRSPQRTIRRQTKRHDVLPHLRILALVESFEVGVRIPYPYFAHETDADHCAVEEELETVDGGVKGLGEGRDPSSMDQVPDEDGSRCGAGRETGAADGDHRGDAGARRVTKMCR